MLLRDNLEAYWDFSNVDGVEYYDRKYNATLTGDGDVTVHSSGVFGNAIRMDGTGGGDYPQANLIDTDDRISFVGSFTFSFWHKPNSVLNNNYSYARGYTGVATSGIQLTVYTGGVRYQFSTWDSNGVVDSRMITQWPKLPSTQYNHICFSYNRITKKKLLVLNGVTKLDVTATQTSTTGSALFNRFMVPDSSSVASDFSEIGFWSRALDVEEINKLWNDGSGRFFNDIIPNAVAKIKN